MIQLKRISINDHDKSTITINCAVDLLLGFRSRAISSCPGANRVVSFDLFSRVCHGDSITRSLARDISTTCVLSFVWRVPLCLSLSSLLFHSNLSSLPSAEKRNVCARSLYFFFSRGRPSSSRAQGGQVPSLPRSSQFPAGPFSPLAGLFAPSAGPLSYFPPGNIAPTRKTIRLGGQGRRKERAAIGLEERSGKCFRVITFVSARTPFLSLISSQAFYLV